MSRAETTSRWASLVLGLGLGVTLGIFFKTTTIHDWDWPYPLITSLSRICAMSGTYLALVGLVMVSRIAWIEKAVGHDRLILWHRKLGPYTLFLIGFHVLLVTLAYANIAIPTLTSEALAAQSASINGVSGASEVSAAWKSSLSSAIAQAASAGEAVGTSSAPVAPATPNPTSTGTSTGTGSTAPAPVSNIPTSVAIAPTYYPFYASCNVSSGSNLSSLISQLSSDVNRIYSRGNGFSSDALSAANRDIANLQAASSQSGGSSTLSACISAADSGMQQWLANANVLFVKYYGQVVDAANKLYADAQASAAAIKAEPAPTVTVTVTATPKPSSGSVINKNVGVIKKSFTCTRTLAGITTRKIVKAFIVKCPVGFTLVKK